MGAKVVSEEEMVNLEKLEQLVLLENQESVAQEDKPAELVHKD